MHRHTGDCSTDIILRKDIGNVLTTQANHARRPFDKRYRGAESKLALATNATREHFAPNNMDGLIRASVIHRSEYQHMVVAESDLDGVDAVSVGIDSC
jgi:hypothetical protein